MNVLRSPERRPHPMKLSLDASDEALWRAFASRGDQQAFVELLSRHAGAMYRLAFRLSRNREDAEDIVQQVVYEFIAKSHAKPQGETASVRGRLLLAVAYRSRDWLRSKQRRRQRHRLLVESNQKENAGGLSTDDHTEDLRRVRKAIGELPDHYRLPLVLRFFDELSFTEIAGLLGLKEKTVQKQVTRALHKIR